MKLNEELVQYLFSCLLKGDLIDYGGISPVFSNRAIQDVYFNTAYGIKGNRRSFYKEMDEALSRYRNLPLVKALSENNIEKNSEE